MKVLRQRIERREDRRSRLGRGAARLLLLFVPVTGLCVLGIGGWHAVTEGPLLEVRELRVEGCGPVEGARFESLASDFLGENLLLADLGAVRARLESDPRVERAAVRRELPHSIRVRVELREPEAVAEIGGQRWLVAGDGVVLGPDRGAAGRPGPPLLVGLNRVAPGEVRERLRRGVAVARGVRLAGEDGASVATLDLARDGWFEAREEGPGPLVRLDAGATPEGIAEALHRYAGIRGRAVSLVGPVAAADLRFRDQIGIVPSHRGRERTVTDVQE